MRDQSISAAEREELLAAAHEAFAEGSIGVCDYQRKLLALGLLSWEIEKAVNTRLCEHMAKACKGPQR